MSSWINYHSHTKYCDGSSAPEEYVKEAIRLKHPAYGFSSHAPVPFETDWNIPEDQLAHYMNDIQHLKDKYTNRIRIFQGLEIDYIPGVSGRSKHILTDINLDYFIGSIHFVDQLADGDFWNIDTSAELFARGLKEIFGNDIRRAAKRFWEVTREMIRVDKPDIIGHLDKIKMFNTADLYFSEKESWYRDEVEATLHLIKQSGSIVEINTRGYYRYGQPDLYPGEWIIRRLAEEEIPVMINSDAHKPHEIESGMAYAADILLSAGIEKVNCLLDQNWEPKSISRDGIVI